MFRVKVISLLVVISSVFLVSCTSGTQYALPDGVTLVPDTNLPQQVATFVSSALTQTAIPATATPINSAATLPIDDTATFTPFPIVATPVVSGSSAQTFYQSSDLGIQFSYPSTWYRQELPGSVILTSFEPSNPPHKLEWKYETTSMEFGFKVFIIPPPFDTWVEDAKLAAQAEGWEISMEERFAIANQPAVRMSLVSGSGGILNRVLIYELNGRYFEINIEGNYNNNLAWTVLNTVQPYSSIVVTAPPPIVSYEYSVVRYRLNLPGDWTVNETNNSSKEVIFSPPYAEPFIAYLSVSLDSRTLDQVINYYAQNMSILNIVREDTIFNGYPAVKYIFAGGRNEYYIPNGNQLILILTDRPNDGIVQSILMTFRFMIPPQPVTYDATMADNGRTFVMNIGDKLRLDLDYGYAWSMASISNPAVLAGAQDGYFAFASGTATLTTIGSPECLNLTPPCVMLPSIMYTITVIVQ